MEQKYIEIENKILEKITPSKKDRKNLERVIQDLKEEVQQEINKRKLNIYSKLVGSVAKDTCLRVTLDIDLFLLFPIHIPREKLEEYVLAIGGSILKNTEECYAEHPYVRGTYQGYKTEIVPCYKIESAMQKLTSVDRTPLHTKYIKDHLLNSQKKDVRLLKQFLKGIGCYGAEADVLGFSGYLCELLIIKYSNFHSLLTNARNWEYGEKITILEGDYLTFETPLTVIDPVDSTRNVASALSEEKFNLFIKASNEYITNPRTTFFFPHAIKPWALIKIEREIKKLNTKFIGLTIAKPAILDENLYPQIRKAINSIREICKRYSFIVYDISFYVEETQNIIFIIISTQKEKLSKTFIHKGPPTKLIKNVNKFVNKWKNHPRVIKGPYETDGKLVVELTREYRELQSLLKKRVKDLSLGKHLSYVAQKNFEVILIDGLLTDNLRIFWTEYLDKKMSWER